MTSEVKDVIVKLHGLATDPENREYIVKDKTCLQAVVTFLNPQNGITNSEQEEVINLSLETLQLLCESPQARQQLAAFPEIKSVLNRVMLDFTVPGNLKQKAGNIYALLQPHFDSPNGNAPLRDTTNTAQQNQRTGLCFFQDRTTTSTTKSITHTYVVNNLHNTKVELEAHLVRMSGVVSFFCDVSQRTIVIRSARSSADLIKEIRDTLGIRMELKDESISQSASQKENDNPDYLPETAESSVPPSGWFSSIVSWGTPTTVDERKEAQRRNEKKKTHKSGRFIDRLWSVGESFWQ